MVKLRKYGRLVLADPPPASYRLQLLARRTEGEEGFAIHLPVGNSDVAAILSCFSADKSLGKFSGLALVDGLDVPFTPDRVPGDIFDDGKDHHVEAIVHPSSVTVKVDGKPIIQWNGDPSRLRAHSWLGEGEKSLFIHGYCGFVIEDAKLEPIEPPVP